MCIMHKKIKKQIKLSWSLYVYVPSSMSKIKRFFSLVAFLIGGLAVAFMSTGFSVAQNYWPLDDYILWLPSFTFIMPRHNVWLYAVIEPNTYTIHFDGNLSTSWSMDDMTMTYDRQENLPENKFERDWFVFEGWSTNPEWPVEYYDQSGALNLTSVDLSTVVLYAQRSVEAMYTVEYYQENVAWDWYEVVTWTQYGISGAVWKAEEKYFTWFTYDSWDVRNVMTWIINGDWSLVLVMYYTRNEYNLIVKDRDTTRTYTWIKFGTDIESILPEGLTWWAWNTFSWWLWVPEGGLMPDHDVEITSDWIYWVHSITFNTDWWTEIEPITGDYWTPVVAPQNPEKPGYRFVGWDPDIPDTIPYDDITVKAIWEKVEEDSWWWGGWWSGWWWRWREWDSWSDESGGEHGAAIDQTSELIDRSRGNMEVMLAYMWARNKWIIDTTRKDSDPDGYVPRWDMAEMVVKFTENVLGWEIPPIPAHCTWWDADSAWKSKEAKMYAEKSCALWVMWIRMQDFLPNKILDRAEFGTILSRLLWWSTYDVVDATETKPYYTRHLAALNRGWIMRQIDNPLARKELRKWAWLMLMRSSSLMRNSQNQ